MGRDNRESVAPMMSQLKSLACVCGGRESSQGKATSTHKWVSVADRDGDREREREREGEREGERVCSPKTLCEPGSGQ